MAKISIKDQINDIFTAYFGRTPLRQRLEDIDKENTALQRWTDMQNLKEEIGDLLASAIQLCNECGWDYHEVIETTLAKIARRKNQYVSLGRKTRVALYGGAFNPVHEGHIAVAQFVLNASAMFDEVWLVPCYQHMGHKDLASPQDRITMCEIAAKKDGRIRVFDYEITHKLAGETYYFIQKLLADTFYTDQYEFAYIIGQDNANTFDKWVNYAHLEKMIPFIVVPRKGITPIKNAWYLKSPHIYMTDEHTIPDFSSTTIRDAFFARKDPVPLGLAVPVLNYIQQHTLYCR